MRLFHDIEPATEPEPKKPVGEKTLSLKVAMRPDAVKVLAASEGCPAKQRLKLARKQFPQWIKETPYRRGIWSWVLRDLLGFHAKTKQDRGTFFDEEEIQL